MKKEEVNFQSNAFVKLGREISIFIWRDKVMEKRGELLKKAKKNEKERRKIRDMASVGRLETVLDTYEVWR